MLIHGRMTAMKQPFNTMKKMRNFKRLPFVIVFLCLVSLLAKAQPNQLWSPEKAWEWYNRMPWLNGVNYIPAYAVNYTAMWDKTTFSAKAIDRELALMEDLGMNCVRVVMQHAVYADDAKYFKKTFRRFLDIAQKHGILVMPIFFDDCAFVSTPTLSWDASRSRWRAGMPGHGLPLRATLWWSTNASTPSWKLM